MFVKMCKNNDKLCYSPMLLYQPKLSCYSTCYIYRCKCVTSCWRQALRYSWTTFACVYIFVVDFCQVTISVSGWGGDCVIWKSIQGNKYNYLVHNWDRVNKYGSVCWSCDEPISLSSCECISACVLIRACMRACVPVCLYICLPVRPSVRP